MGNGHFPQEGFSKASFFTDLQIIVEGNDNLKASENIITFAPKPHCYNVQKSGNYFFYGGPGRNVDSP
ncbi:hypothetical protein CFP56_011358 [Quercus suber]|uniref:Neprosin PEP catalytic domain-containing protein n=1 Tax=Quercus suber TaxID=58331 RepID=A0AAW0MCA4_QUESU